MTSLYPVFTFCVSLVLAIVLTTQPGFASTPCQYSANPTHRSAVPGHTVFFAERYYEDLVYDHFPSMPGAVMIRPKGDRFEHLRHTKKYVILLHGVGADYSNPNSMLHQFENYAGSYASSGSPSYGKKQILAHPSFREGIYSEILPLMGSSFGGPNFREVKKLEEVLRPIVEHIREARRFLPSDAEIIVHGRSYGASLAASLAHRHPGLVNKLILVGLATPEKSIIAENMAIMRAKEEESRQGIGEKLVLNWDWMLWFDHMLMQDKWYEYSRAKQVFGGAKTLILIGEADWQVSATERVNYADMSLKFANVSFALIPSTPHDATNTRNGSNRISRMGVLANTYAFDLIFGP